MKASLLDHLAVCPSVFIFPPVVAGQWLGKHVPTATNSYTAIEELLNMSFSVWSVSYKRKLGD
jgi:hypothetical protein